MSIILTPESYSHAQAIILAASQAYTRVNAEVKEQLRHECRGAILCLTQAELDAIQAYVIRCGFSASFFQELIGNPHYMPLEH